MKLPSLTSLRDAALPGEIPLLVLLAVCGISTLWMTASREEGYAVECVDESDLYHLEASPRIEGIDFDDDTGEVILDVVDSTEDAWVVIEQGPHGSPSAPHRSASSSSSAHAPASAPAEHPRLELELGLQHFEVIGQETARRFSVHTQWVPGGKPVITPTPIRIGEGSPFSSTDFIMDVDAESPEGVAKAKAILDAMPISDKASDLERAAVIAASLHHDLTAHRGVPGPQMRGMNGLEQYEEAMAGRSGVFCANHAEIFSYFANVAGLPTRLLDVRGEFDGIALGAHTFNEVYIEKLDQWIYIDLQTSTAGIRDGSGHYLSTIELIDRLHYDSTRDLRVLALEGGQFRDRAFDGFGENGGGGEGGDILRALLSSESVIVYLPAQSPRFSTGARLKRLLVDPPPAVCSGGIEHRPGRRIAMTFLTGLIGLFWVGRRLTATQ